MSAYWSIGDITKTKYWLSLELRRGRGWGLHIGPTYGGTRTGIVLSFGVGVLIGHVRGLTP